MLSRMRFISFFASGLIVAATFNAAPAAKGTLVEKNWAFNAKAFKAAATK